MPTPEISEGKVKPERGGETEMTTITPSSTLTQSNNNTTFKCVSQQQVVENTNNVPPCSDYELALQLHAAELETARVAREMRRLGISGGSKRMSSLRR
jgi:hypothetical protein